MQEMKVSELIRALMEIKREYGDLYVYVSNDVYDQADPVDSVDVIDPNDEEEGYSRPLVGPDVEYVLIGFSG